MTVPVPIRETRDASYTIVVGTGLLADLPHAVRTAAPALRYAVITDSTVAPLYGKRVVDALRAAALSADLFSFPAGEPHKTRDTWAGLSDQMLAAGVGRDAVVIALGGGVVGDVAGFAAATYLRGVPYVQVPTTLLAMIDASVGGKTGVDVPAGKNLIGAFHQPRLVLADLDVLASLPREQLAAGMAEAVKHGVIADADYFQALESTHAAVLRREPAALERTVARSVQIKAAIVVADERESGRRAILNFGHTVAHALEVTAHYTVLHGEAVAVGMVCEARLAESLGLAPKETAARIAALLERCGLPKGTPNTASVDALIDAMQRDKKARAGAVRFALPKAIGAMHGDDAQGWTVAAPEAAVRAILAGR
ncbi:MAG TPA: 3-dehydroquinate synthase [Gemmatimonadales bacterium]|nr:3-dehydroquinate synthase [Gemmatimonadales bacterium]